MADGNLLIIKIVSEKYVKPSSSTPPSSRCYKLSSRDQDMPDSLVSLSFFYPKQSFHGPTETAELCRLLETSLSKALTYYYPFAGRLTDNICVDCNDEGVKFWEVQVQASMSEILDHNAKDFIFPREQLLNSSDKGHLLMVQLNHFQCGAFCVGISISHKLGDAQTICNFMNDWAAIARGSQETPSPLLDGASVFPPSTLPLSKHSHRIAPGAINCVRRRFVFSASNISKLKAMVVEDSRTENPTKVEVVTALIFKTAVAAASAKSNSFKPSLLFQVANIRPITVPPMSENYVGNFIINFWISATDEKETNLSALVSELRRSKQELQNRYRKNFEGGKLQSELSIHREDLRNVSSSFDQYVFTSWCRFPFYEVDFGWGKPIFLCLPSASMKNLILLMDTKNGDGIEALVALEEAQMSIFEHSEELLSFAVVYSNI